MAVRSPRVWAIAMTAALEGYARLGLDPDEICRRSGVDRAALADPEARVPLEVGNRMWAVADALWGRPVLGLRTGVSVPLGAYHALDYLVVTAETFAEAFEAVVRYFRLVTEGATRLELLGGGRGDGVLALSFVGPVPFHIRDYAFGIVANRARRLGGEIRDVCFAGPALGAPRDYERVLGIRPRFHQPRSVLQIAPGAVRPPELADHPRLREIVEWEAQRLLGRLGGEQPTDDVRAAILALLPQGRPPIGAVARRLHVSVRTLQRRMRGEGWTYTGLVDAVRAELARQHLHERRLSIAEVGYVLGFSEPASFTRACVRWFGRPPGRLRGRPGPSR